MPKIDLNPLTALAIQEAPQIIAIFKDIFHRQNQDSKITDEEAVAALKLAFDSSLAKDDNWLAVHPKEGSNT